MVERLLAATEAVFDRLFSSRFNPLYQSGTLVLVSLGVLSVSGIYLFLFYDIDAPYASVARIDAELWLGGWMRSLHAYAADMAMLTAAVHALKMWRGARSFGPRTRAWITGVVLVGLLLVCGWTGQVMAWDLQGQVVAVELTRLMDLVPIFTVPLGRTFSRLAPVPGSFFFMNLFLHVCLPLGLGLVLWLHLAHLGRPALAPPKPLLWGSTAALAVVAAALPVALAPAADLRALPREVPTDLFYNFWLPLAWRVGPAWHALAWAVAGVALLSVPWWPRVGHRPKPPSWVDPQLCTGCTTCYQDCPFDAISMVERPDPGRHSAMLARVDPARCVSCGICAGSCAPMGVGPPGRSGRFQLEALRTEIAEAPLMPGEIVVVACRHNRLGADPAFASDHGVRRRSVDCVGNLHTSVIESLLRSGAAGVYMLTCPARDAVCREGPKWLSERVFHDREAELAARVDKRRVRIAGFAPGEWRSACEDLARFADALTELEPEPVDATVDVGGQCEADVEAAS